MKSLSSHITESLQPQLIIDFLHHWKEEFRISQLFDKDEIIGKGPRAFHERLLKEHRKMILKLTKKITREQFDMYLESTLLCDYEDFKNTTF